MNNIRQAVLPVAGLGTRFLPATKTIPKEMLPIVDKPQILLVVEELVQAGVEEIILVTGRGKQAIEDFFDHSIELELHLEKRGQIEWLNDIVKLRSQVQFVSVRQLQPQGLGHAVLTASRLIGNNAFYLALCDEIFQTNVGQKNPLQLLADRFRQTGLSTVGVLEVPKADIPLYGVVACRDSSKFPLEITEVVEKPTIQKAPSPFVLPGRYIFTSELFQHLGAIQPGRLGEIQLTDAMTRLAQSQGMEGLLIPNKRFDTGNKLGYVQANVEFMLNHPQMGKPFREYLEKLIR